jgi:hypothetical protein
MCRPLVREADTAKWKQNPEYQKLNWAEPKLHNSGRIVDVRCLVALVLAASAYAADLNEIRATQQRLVAARNSDKPPRDEVPLEDVALGKRQLLSWAESRLQTFGRNADPVVLTKALSKELQDGIEPRSGDSLDRLGDLDVAFSRPGGEPVWLQMSTDVGIPCGADRSIYLYEWRGDRWNRRFALEANEGSRANYGPQNFVEIQISPVDARGARLILATGYPPACMSVWQTLYIRLFRVGATQTLLLEQTPTANQGEDYSARLEPNGALVKFDGFGIDASYLIRPHVLHYQLDHGKVQRIEPIALSPRDFVEEWLTRPWNEISVWSEPQLAEWHKKLHKDPVSGVYDAVRGCRNPGQWQISIDFDDKTTSYFSVLDRGDSRFKMLRVSERPRTDCSGRNELEN